MFQKLELLDQRLSLKWHDMDIKFVLLKRKLQVDSDSPPSPGAGLGGGASDARAPLFG